MGNARYCLTDPVGQAAAPVPLQQQEGHDKGMIESIDPVTTSASMLLFAPAPPPTACWAQEDSPTVIGTSASSLSMMSGRK